MTLQYLEALKALGASPSTKFILPLELSQLAQKVGNYVEAGFTAPPAAGSTNARPARSSGPAVPPAPGGSAPDLPGGPNTPDSPSMGTSGGQRGPRGT
jgi:hypothetical protein